MQRKILYNRNKYRNRYLRRMIWEYLIIPLLAVSLFGCKNIPRDNPLDPKNPASIRPQKILIEAFVNTNDSLQVNINEFALAALDTLNSIYPNQLIILDYHRNTRDYIDPYHLVKNESLYQHYINQFNSFPGVPDIFINGTIQRVQGASSTINSIIRLSSAAGAVLNQNCEFSIEIEHQINGNQVIPTVRVARLGNRDARDIIVKAVLIAGINENFLKRVVRDISFTRINLIENGTFQTVTLNPLIIREAQFRHSLVVYVMDDAEREVFQCEIARIP